MSMFNTGDILETIEMFTQDNLDVRTVTMGISLLDCIDPDPKKACENIYNKITTKGRKPCAHGGAYQCRVRYSHHQQTHQCHTHRHAAGCLAPEADPVDFAKTLDAAGKKVGVNFVGGSVLWCTRAFLPVTAA